MKSKYRKSLDLIVKALSTENEKFFIEGEVKYDDSALPVMLAKVRLGKKVGCRTHLSKPHEIKYVFGEKPDLIGVKEISFEDYGSKANISWLEKREMDHFYHNQENGGTRCLTLPEAENPPDEHPQFPGFFYSYTKAFTMGGYIKIQFERNGRIGYEYRYENKKRTVSATREKYEHNAGNIGADQLKKNGGKIDSSTVYTKAVGKEAEKIQKTKDEKFARGLKSALGGK